MEPTTVSVVSLIPRRSSETHEVMALLFVVTTVAALQPYPTLLTSRRPNAREHRIYACEDRAARVEACQGAPENRRSAAQASSTTSFMD